MPQETKWTFRKTIDIPTLVTLVVLTIAGFRYVSGIEQAVVINTHDIETTNARLAEYKSETTRRFDRIDAKLDALTDAIHSYQTNK